MLIIGLTGRLQSGKDSTFEAISKLDGVKAHRLAFADPLKRELARACGVTVDFINANKPAFRPGLQWFGSEFRRGLCGQDYWIKIAEAQVRNVKKMGGQRPNVLVFTDVRFQNEADMIRRLGGLVWKVKRPALHPVKTFFKNLFRWEHVSESTVDQIVADAVINNCGTIDDLRHSVQREWLALHEISDKRI